MANEHPSQTATGRCAPIVTIEERASLASELIASIDGESDQDAERAWAAEIERRARRAIAGESHGTDWDTVQARIASTLASP